MLEEVDQVAPPGSVAELLSARLEDVNAPPATRVDFPATLVAIAATALIAVCGT